ncbi:MAG: alpha/beta hydrolase-fold protein [Acidobacteriota bacterium]
MKSSTNRSKAAFETLTSIAASALLSLGACLPNNTAATTFSLGPNKAVSPRIAALEREIKAGNLTTLDQFWQTVTSEGTPVIEPIQGDSRNTLVTFLWRAKQDTSNVVVFALGGGEPLRNQMSRLANTDLWYRTYLVPRDARFTYLLSANDSLVPFDELEEKDFPKRTATFKIDPLNKRPALGGGSIVELPDAPTNPWIGRQTDTPKGKFDNAKIKSAILNNERRAWVYTPPGYSRDAKPYGLIVMFDGLMYTLLIPTATILDNLLAQSKAPPLVALILDNPTAESRNTEFACYEPFAEFIAKEAIPWVRANYNVTTNPSQTVVSGVSFGGLAAAFVGYRHPEIFGNVISQSGSFWWKPGKETEPEWLTRQFASSPRLPLRFHLQVGLFETGPNPGGAPDMVAVSRHLRDVLKARGYEVGYDECNCGHDYLNWRGALPDALITLVGSSGNQKK